MAGSALLGPLLHTSTQAWLADLARAVTASPVARERRPLVIDTAPEPDTIAGWRAVADGFLSDPCCAFHRNVEISSCYAWIHQREPACFKWAAMASHHIRLVLFPLRLDADRTGFVDIPHSLGRRKLLLTQDVDTIRATNNAIFNDIFWVHLAYVTADDGIGSATSFEVRGVRREVASFTPFYLYSLSRGIPHALRAPAWPRITRYDDRWRWLVTSVVPRFRRIDAGTCLVSASLRRISDESRHLASAPCVLPHSAR